MKKSKISLLLMAAAVVMSGTFSSCNKKLKDDIKDLDKQVSDLQSQNATLQAQQSSLQAQQNETSTIIGYPFTMSMTTTDASDAAVSINRTYHFWTGTDYCYMGDNGNGTYYFDVEITEAANWDLEGYMYGTYNPTTGAVTNSGVYLSYYDKNWNTMYPQFYSSDANATLTWTVNSFDTTTGMVDIKVVGSTTAASGNNIYTGKPMNATFTYKGYLAPGFN